MAVCVAWAEDFCPLSHHLGREEPQTDRRRLRRRHTLAASLGQSYTRPVVQVNQSIQALVCRDIGMWLGLVSCLPAPGCISDEEGCWQWPWGLSALRSVEPVSESPRKRLAVTLRTAGRSVPRGRFSRWSCHLQQSVQQQLPADYSVFLLRPRGWSPSEVWIKCCDFGSHLKSCKTLLTFTPQDGEIAINFISTIN